MARADLRTAFEHTRLPYGDDGKQVRGIVARCGSPGCTTAIPLPVNAQANTGGNDAEIEWRFIARKLEAKGWQVGRRYQDHRCPRCQRNERLGDGEKPVASYGFSSKRGELVAGNLKLVKDAFMSSTTPQTALPAQHVASRKHDPAPAKPPAPAADRTMTRDDRRIIFAKLEEVYVDENTGYGDGWSDSKVAADLAVPVAWVRTIRDENFGEEITSANIREKLADAMQLIAGIKKLQPAIDEARKLIGIADKIEKEVAAIAKAMGVTK